MERGARETGIRVNVDADPATDMLIRLKGAITLESTDFAGLIEPA